MRGSQIIVVGGLVLAAFVTATLGHARLAQAVPPTYTITEIGPSEPVVSYAYGINTAGWVAGWSDPGRAFVWRDGAFGYLPTPLGGSTYVDTDINAPGDVIARYGLGRLRGCIWRDSLQTDLGALGPLGETYPLGINDHGEVVGWSNTGAPGSTRPFIWKEGTLSALPGEWYDGTARAINNKHQIVGEGAPHTGDRGAFMWEEDKITALGISYAFDISENGVVAGDTTVGGYRCACLWQEGVVTPLGSLPGYPESTARGLNNLGSVVGSVGSGIFLSQRAFLYQEGTLYDLNNLIPHDSGWLLQAAENINDLGYIVGYGRNPDGLTRGFLLTPEPATLSLLALGALALLRRKRASEGKR